MAPEPGPNRDTFFITRRGARVKNAIDLEVLRKADLLPRKLLHPVIAEKIWALFLRGDYDTAIFQAFKEVEVAVREAGHYQVTDYGLDLMRKAFDVNTGPLTDKDRPRAEREALSHLFAGAFGLYKNPSSHRKVIVEPEEAVEILLLASHLFRIVDIRTAANKK